LSQEIVATACGVATASFVSQEIVATAYGVDSTCTTANKYITGPRR